MSTSFKTLFITALALLTHASLPRAAEVVVAGATASTTGCGYAGGQVRVDSTGAVYTVGSYPWCSTTYGYYGYTAAYPNYVTYAGAAGRTVTAYDSATGTRAAGQQGAAFNSVTGDYAYGERGAVVNERTGAAAAGSHGTVGNAATGRELEGARGAAYDPDTGRVASAAGVHGENGGVARVGRDVYVGHGGQVRQLNAPRRNGGGARPKR